MLLFFKFMTKPDRFDCISYEYCNQLFLNFDVQENHFIGNRREEQNTLTMFVKVDLVNVKVTKCVYTYNFRFTSSHCKTISLCSLPPQKESPLLQRYLLRQKRKCDFPEITWPFSFRERTFFGTSLLQLNQISDRLFSNNKRPSWQPLKATLDIFPPQHIKLLFC